MSALLRSAWLLSTLALAAGAAGCALDDESSVEDDLRISPKGTELWSNLTVALPTGTCQPGGSCLNPLGEYASVLLDGGSVAIGAKTRVKPGDHTLTVNGAVRKVTLAASEDRTFTLAVARRACEAAPLPEVPITDFGRTLQLANATCPDRAKASDAAVAPKPTLQLFASYYNCYGYYTPVTLTPDTTAAQCDALGTSMTYYSVLASNTGLCRNLDGGLYPTNAALACHQYVAGDLTWAGIENPAPKLADHDLAFVPGGYTLRVSGVAEPVAFQLAEGERRTVAVGLPVLGEVPEVFTTEITFADPRELPDASAAYIASTCGDRGYYVPAATTAPLALKAFKAPGCSYGLIAAGRQAALDQDQANHVELHRLDVDHPVITREDGSTYVAPGTYELYHNGVLVFGPVSTATGVDVLAGTYEVVIKYTTADGPQTQHQIVEL